MEYVFVYGTLRRGEVNDHYLKDAAVIALAASVEGQLVDTGLGYPALVRDANRERVVGELYVVDGITLAELDRLEDYYGTGDPRNEYERIPVRVETDSGIYEAWVYVYPDGRNLQDLPVIEDGDWVRWRAQPGR